MIIGELGSLRFDLFYLHDLWLLKFLVEDILGEENGMCWRLLNNFGINELDSAQFHLLYTVPMTKILRPLVAEIPS